MRSSGAIATLLLLVGSACSGGEALPQGPVFGTFGAPTGVASPSAESSSADSGGDSGSDSSTSAADSTSGDATGVACDAPNEGEPARFRFTSLNIRDPHLFSPSLCTVDITDLPEQGINAQINSGLNNDNTLPPDGLLSLGIMIELDPLAPAHTCGPLQGRMGTADCTAPVETTTCAFSAGKLVTETPYVNHPQGGEPCLLPDPDELSPEGYVPLPTGTDADEGPCLRMMGAISFTLEFPQFPLALQMTNAAAQYVGDPADGLVEGFLRGFLTVSSAQATVLPDDLPVVGGHAISELLAAGPGGPGHITCAHDDRDADGGLDGWWFHMNFEAERVELTP
ncbi:MAG: hypothetical protein AAF799_41390 [Myxococcota bacterium]